MNSTLIQSTPEEIKETTERPDSIWLSLSAGTDQKTTIVDWGDINDINGNFGEFESVIVTGIPLYGSSDILHDATVYVFNQIEINEKTKENKSIFRGIGGNG